MFNAVEVRLAWARVSVGVVYSLVVLGRVAVGVLIVSVVMGRAG